MLANIESSVSYLARTGWTGHMWGSGSGWWMSWWMGLAMLVFWTAVIWAIVKLSSNSTGRERPRVDRLDGPEDTPSDLVS